MADTNIHRRLCGCGCGQPTPIAKITRKERGVVKGQPTRYLRGHRRYPFRTPNPLNTGLCGCGCGQVTPLAKQTRGRYGHIKGQPTRYVHGHDARATLFRTPEQRGVINTGLCACGCGQATALATQTHNRHGLVKGQPTRYVSGHSAGRCPLTPEQRAAKARAWKQLRRARTKAVPAEHILRPVVWARDGGMCGICQQPADPTDWHLDHIISLTNGGPHLYWNVWVTHPHCNHRKGAKFLPYALKLLPDALQAAA